MNKRTLLILIFTLNFLSLIFIILQYFGYIRCLTLCNSSSESYIKNYKNVPSYKELKNMNEEKIISPSRVVISLTTTPETIEKLRPTLLSLLDQTVRVDEISLNLLDSKEYKIPSDFNDIVNVFRSGKDYGNVMNVIPPILRELDTNTLIISVREGKVYGKDFVETMIVGSAPHTTIRGDLTNFLVFRPNSVDITDTLDSIKNKNFERLEYNEII